MEFADELAHELVTFAEARGMTPHELLAGLSLTQDMLNLVFPGTARERLDAIQEARATFLAHTAELAAN